MTTEDTWKTISTKQPELITVLNEITVAYQKLREANERQIKALEETVEIQKKTIAILTPKC